MGTQGHESVAVLCAGLTWPPPHWQDGSGLSFPQLGGVGYGAYAGMSRPGLD